MAWWVAQQGPSTVLFVEQENERDGKAEEQAAGIVRDGDEGSAYGAYACAGAVRDARARLGPGGQSMLEGIGTRCTVERAHGAS